MANFYNTVIRNSKAFRSDARCGSVELLEPGTRAAVTALVQDAHDEGIDLRVLETYRSQTRQSALFMKRATQLRTVGCHGYGVAADFGVFVDGKYATDAKPYLFLRHLARRHGLISGLDWGKKGPISWDSGHVQRVPVWRQSALFSGTWYPPADYDPYADSAAHGRREVVFDIGPWKRPAAPKLDDAPGSVAWTQARLNAWAPSFALTVNGIMLPDTEYAVRRYQEEHGMTPTGKIDAALVAALGGATQS